MTVNRAAGGILRAALLLAVGCGSDPKQPPAGPAEIEIIHLDASNNVIETQPMGQVPLIAPPQGGWVLLLGVRAKNVDGAHATLATALVDACDQQVMQLERRSTVLDPVADGWGQSSLTTFSNLAVCPAVTATRDLHDVPYIITVSVEDTDGQKATASLTVVPTCPTDASRCPCECDRDYVLGADCPAVPVPHGTCNTADRMAQ